MDSYNQNLINIRNEADANRTVAKIMLTTYAIFTIILILNIAGIFIINQTVIICAYIFSGILLISPSVLNRIYDSSNPNLKWIYLIFAELFLLILIITLSYHIVLIYSYPIAIAVIYFSRKTTIFSIIMTGLITIIGQVISFYCRFTVDDNVTTEFKLIVFSILPRLLVFISFGCLLYLLSERSGKLLSEEMEDSQKLIQQHQDMVYGFATLVETRDESTGEHIKQTSKYVEAIVKALKRKGLYSDIIDDTYIKNLVLAAPMHDIGKISIPDNILQKPGKLSDEEFSIMKTHSDSGSHIIQKTFSNIGDENYRKIAYEVTRYHHERWDGNGYPEKLSKLDIPLSSRIMTIADVFDAVSEDRCYRKALPLEECFKIIEDGKYRNFDPMLVDVFLEIRDEIEKIYRSVR